jgi:TonB-dependent SusC/RagA subfamily outer membrane receptor
MMSSLMVYGMVLTAFLAAGTYFLDRGLRSLRRPTRWAWALGMTAAVSFVLASAAWSDSAEMAPAGGVVPVEVLYEMLAGDLYQTPTPSSGPISLDGPLTLLWLLGSISLLVAALWAGRLLHRARRRWDTHRLGSQEVLVSDGLGPAVFGLFRPVIVVPHWVLGLSAEEQEMILLHEREHQAARDPALLALALVMLAVTPWNPALWWMARRLHLAVEGDCDARVLARGVSAKRYGRLLLEVASGGRGFSALTPALAEGGETFLERRLLMIRSTVRKKGLLAVAVPMILSAGFLVLACETPTPPASLEATLTVETSNAASLENSAVPAEISEGEDGYFLVRKGAGKVEYVGPVSEGQLQRIREDEPGEVFRVREISLPDEPSASATGRYEEVAPEEEEGGTIRIRKSEGEDASPRPLIIVDGVISSDPNILETMDKDDIASIEIVKGAAAEAIYGQRAAGGVVKITTKK